MYGIFVYIVLSLCVDVFVYAGDVLRFIHCCAWRMIVEICALLGYAASNGNPLPTFWDNVLVPSSRVKKMGPIRCPETSVKDYHSTLHNNPEECTSHQHRSRSLKSRNTSCVWILCL
jgi:hypothetical protein